MSTYIRVLDTCIYNKLKNKLFIFKSNIFKKFCVFKPIISFYVRMKNQNRASLDFQAIAPYTVRIFSNIYDWIVFFVNKQF